jgi:hypothetical protein
MTDVKQQGGPGRDSNRRLSLYRLLGLPVEF